MTFGLRIREHRVRSGLSLRELAREAGLDYSYVSKIENGRLEHAPSTEIIERLAFALDADELELLALANRLPSALAKIVAEPEARRFYQDAVANAPSPAQWRELRAMLAEREARGTPAGRRLVPAGDAR